MSGLDVIGVSVGERKFSTAGSVRPQFVPTQVPSDGSAKPTLLRQWFCRLPRAAALSRLVAASAPAIPRICKTGAFLPSNPGTFFTPRLLIKVKPGSFVHAARTGAGCVLILNTNSPRSRSNQRWMI